MSNINEGFLVPRQEFNNYQIFDPFFLQVSNPDQRNTQSTMQNGGKPKGEVCGDMFLNYHEAQVKPEVQLEHFIACFYGERCLDHSFNEASDKTPTLIQKLPMSI